MTKRLVLVLVGTLLVTTLFASGAVRSAEGGRRQLTVHEWGTFTAIAGDDGRPMRWVPLSGPNDLPCFVERTPNIPEKSTLWATVRMETPVLYFYAPAETKVDVDVRFPLGLMTEYFPTARVRGGSIAWTGVRLAPGSDAAFPIESEPSHYYAARDTHAAPLHVGSQTERFLFYRGVGSFPLPLSATVDAGDNVTVTSLARDPIGSVVLFENRGRQIGYRIVDLAGGSTTISRPSPGATLATLTAELERTLMDHGLFPEEAAAMVATWRDSWFEEGTRLFFVMPPQTVDSILPLRIRPQPSQTVRVFVGRLELITPTLMHDVSVGARASDWAVLSKYGRFLMPIADRIVANTTLSDRRLIEQRLQTAFASFGATAASAGCSGS